MSGIHFHLFAASLIAVASFTQAQEMLIKPEDIHRAAVAPAVVELAWSAKQNAVFVSSPDWKDEKNRPFCALIRKLWKRRPPSLLMSKVLASHWTMRIIVSI